MKLIRRVAYGITVTLVLTSQIWSSQQLSFANKTPDETRRETQNETVGFGVDFLQIPNESQQIPAQRRRSYPIEVSHNDEFFIINGEKFEAKTYCFDMEVGDPVIFIDG